MKRKHISSAILAAVLCISGGVLAACPSADLSGDCFVDLEDFSLLAGQWLADYDSNDLAAMALEWLTEGTAEPDITWVYIDDPGVSGHEGFTGQMSKYETTNAQYCEFLNAALASGDITVSGNYVYGANGSNSGADFVGQGYYNLAGSGDTYDGATDGGAARINWTGSSFTVDAGFENHPVTYVNWYGSTAFAGYYGWRLPTEWEWRAVADYTGSFVYGCGTTITNSMANYYGSAHPNGTTVVGAFGTYGYGMCDMAGNVWEWTDSIYSGCRVIRGGSWSHDDDYCSVSDWLSGRNPLYSSDFLGFRVCR
jgi:formylglycine-generating enzyme required for sulfatase activity